MSGTVPQLLDVVHTRRLVCGLPVGQVLPERARARGPGGAPGALNDLAPWSWGASPSRWPAGRPALPPSPEVAWGAAAASAPPSASQTFAAGPAIEDKKGAELCHGANLTGVP
jgi:hypothetical protein